MFACFVQHYKPHQLVSFKTSFNARWHKEDINHAETNRKVQPATQQLKKPSVVISSKKYAKVINVVNTLQNVLLSLGDGQCGFWCQKVVELTDAIQLRK